MTTPTDDASVVARSLTEPECFGELYDRHHLVVFRYVRSRLGDSADDVVGDTFVEAFRCRAGFDSSRGASALPWLLGIATNMIGRRRELERRWMRTEPTAQPSTSDDDAAIDERVMAAALSPRLRAAIAGLRKRDRVALLLHVAGDLTIEEVARAMDCPVGTIKSRLHRARRTLAANLEVHR